MIIFSRLEKNFERINFDKIVTDASMRKYLGYDILEGRVPLSREGKIKKSSDKAPHTRSVAKRVPSRWAQSKKNVGKSTKAISKHDALNNWKGKIDARGFKATCSVMEAVPKATAASSRSSEDHLGAVQNDPGMPEKSQHPGSKLMATPSNLGVITLMAMVRGLRPWPGRGLTLPKRGKARAARLQKGLGTLR